MSRTLMPHAYMLRMLSSKPLNDRWCFFTNFGSNVPLRSRGTSTVTSPWSVRSVFCGLPSSAASLKAGKTVGSTGTMAFVAPAADAGGAESVSVANGVLVEQSVEVAHGELARYRARVEHYSSDGVSSPVS